MKEHGHFEVRRLGRVVEVQLADSFNLEGAQALIAEITRVSDPLAGEPWAILYDVRNFGLATPEVMLPWVKFALWQDHRERTHVAVVSEESMLQAIVSEHASNIAAELRFFSCRDEALAWLESAGFQ